MKNLFSLAFVLLALAACGKGEDPAPTVTPAPPVSRPAAPASQDESRDDYAQPYLTDAKVRSLIASMKEPDKNPFTPLLSGQAWNPLRAQQMMDEINAYARRHGFENYEDYVAVWGRVSVGLMQIMGEEVTAATRQMLEAQVQANEEELRKPDLDPEIRKALEEAMQAAKEQLQMMNEPAPSDGLNAKDLALVRKHKPEIEEASRMYKAPTPKPEPMPEPEGEE